MQAFTFPIFLVALPAVIFALIAVMVVAFRVRPAKPSRVAIVVVVLPAILMLVLFYSLAIHMRQSLGAWPDSIGTHGFPEPLIAHATVATGYFAIIVLAGMFAWPVVFLTCSLVQRWRVCLYYLGAHVLACLVCFGAMLLAPSRFLYWWWD